MNKLLPIKKEILIVLSIVVFFLSMFLLNNYDFKSFFQKAEVNITNECTVNGLGKVTCSFRNDGDIEGAVCVRVSLKRFMKSDWYDNKKYDEDEKIVGSRKICSGLVKPMDVVDRSYSISFSLETESYSEIEPADFCRSKFSDEKWYTGCSFYVDLDEEAE